MILRTDKSRVKSSLFCDIIVLGCDYNGCIDDIKEIICFNLILINELIEYLGKDIVNQFIDISRNKMKGICNAIDHDYDNTDFDNVWLAVTIDIKSLREYCEKVLKEN